MSLFFPDSAEMGVKKGPLLPKNAFIVDSVPVKSDIDACEGFRVGSFSSLNGFRLTLVF